MVPDRGNLPGGLLDAVAAAGAGAGAKGGLGDPFYNQQVSHEWFCAPLAQVKASFKLSEDFKKGPPKKKVVKKPAAKKVRLQPTSLLSSVC